MESLPRGFINPGSTIFSPIKTSSSLSVVDPVDRRVSGFNHTGRDIDIRFILNKFQVKQSMDTTFERNLTTTTINNWFKASVVSLALIFTVFGSVPNIELAGIKMQGVGKVACAEEVPLFIGGSCYGTAAAWIPAFMATAAAGYGIGGVILDKAKKIGRLTPVGIALTALGYTLRGLGIVFGTISFLIAGNCTVAYLSEILI